ncbi:hypothetical protein F5Y18DRAFT_431209 [Xylariaceae sp. FL1019]|nr:hypothetical protein F5Y18DRAFT_431209 [Xylariaceae sp. FL1019]
MVTDWQSNPQDSPILAFAHLIECDTIIGALWARDAFLLCDTPFLWRSFERDWEPEPEPQSADTEALDLARASVVKYNGEEDLGNYIIRVHYTPSASVGAGTLDHFGLLAPKINDSGTWVDFEDFHMQHYYLMAVVRLRALFNSEPDRKSLTLPNNARPSVVKYNGNEGLNEPPDPAKVYVIKYTSLWSLS